MVRKMIKGVVAALFAAVALAPCTALADPVTWTLSGVTFDDGGTASGTFVYDEDTSTYSSVNITTTAGTTRLIGGAYDHASTAVSSNATGAYFGTAAGDVTGGYLLGIVTAAPKTDLGGTLALKVAGSPRSGEGTCITTPCTNAGGDVRYASAGSISAPVAAVPTLSEWAMILLGLTLAGGAALVIQRRRLTA